MKNLMLSVLLGLGTTNILANDKGNGGDICENKMQNISKDIETWLLNDNFKGIKLPGVLSEEKYRDGMLEAVKISIISCTSDKVFIGGSEKTCKNFADEKGDIRIQCNFDRFLKTDGKEQYRLMHHEFAGVAGFESNNGEEASNYRISDQISEFLKEETVYMLGVKSVSYSNHRDFGLEDLPEGSIIEISKNLNFGIGQTVISGKREAKTGRQVIVVYKKDSKFERVVKPRKCQLKKVKSPFANGISSYKVFLTGDSVCNSLVLEYFASGFAWYSATNKAAKDLGINIITPEAREE